MALIDFLQKAETITGPKAPSGIETPLVSADYELARAKQNQELRVKREDLQRRIDNLRAQKEQLEARKKEIKENSLSNTPEDKIVAIAKAKGIKDADIDTWLRARQQRSAREISEGQRQELGRGAKAQEEANKDAAIQAVFDAEEALMKAESELKTARLEEKEWKESAAQAAKNKFESLKSRFENSYGEKWDDISKKLPQKPKAEGQADGKNGGTRPEPEVTLEDDEITALRINEPGLLETFRSGSGMSYDQKLAIKSKAKDYIAAEIRKRKEEAEAEAKEKRKKAEAEAEEKEKKKAEAQKTRSDIVSKAKDGKFSNKTKRNMAVDYCDTFRDAGEVPPKLADAWKILFDEEMTIIK